ncbi:unnamed protein product [Penicillium palitans]
MGSSNPGPRFRCWTSRQTRAFSTSVPPWSRETPVIQGISTSDCDEDSLYRYTSGRWLWNEKEQFSRRYVKFNLAELDYLKVAQSLSPEDKEISKPVLWHPDLHGDNIFVNPDRPTEILSIIDWQAVNLSPLFLQARHPALIEFEGPFPEGLQSIRLPANFDQLSAEEQLEANKLRPSQSLYKLYDIQIIQDCPEIAASLRFRNSLPGQITGLSGSLFGDGEPIVQGMLIRLQEEWATYIGSYVPCPLSFTEEDKQKQKEDEKRWASGVVLMEEFLDQVGIYRGWDGWVNHSDYEYYKVRLEQCRPEFLDSQCVTNEERSQWESVWPFMGK